MKRQRPFQRKALVTAVAAAGLMTAPALLAQESQLEEVIVTASARQQSVQDIPYNISAMSGEEMVNQQITDG